MPNFIFAYHGGEKPESPEEGAKMMEQWKAWVVGLGDSAVEPGNPVGLSKTVSEGGVADNGGADPLMGYSVIKADSIDDAVDMAKNCPHVHLIKGSIEVAEIKQM